MFIIMCAIIWYLIGCGCFIYWWATEYDFTAHQLPTMLFIGCFGPIAFFMGWYIHGNNTNNLIIFKKRK